MSPVSRGRKTKKNKKRRSGRTVGVYQPDVPAVLRQSAGVNPRPAWFDSSIEAVLDGARSLLVAQGPRQLEEASARLLGAELHQALDRDDAMRFDWWFEEVARSAAARVRDALDGTDGAWQAPWRLLHGLTSIGSPALASGAGDALAELRPRVSGTGVAQPQWLGQLSGIAATGEVWHLRDVYGTRIAVIAGFGYPAGGDRSVFLFDFDACGFVTLAHAGVFDDVEQAAAAWRALVGEAAGDGAPGPARTADELQALVYWETGEMHVLGTETRAVMDNWYRAPRRAIDLAEALRERGMALPQPRSLYQDVDIDPVVAAFTGWYRQRHGVEPDPEAVDALAGEWLEGALPGTTHAASPHRVAFQLRLMNDWVPDHPVTIAAKALLPEWVRWHGEQADLPESFIDRAVAVAAGGSRAATDCPAAD